MTAAILIFAKEPRPGKVKTRLIPALGAQKAAGLYECFLKDAMGQCARIGARRSVQIYLVISPDSSPAYFERMLNSMGFAADDVRIRLQEGDDLGERLLHAFESVLPYHSEGAVILGTDHPTLPDENIELALDKLNTHDLVIGPAEDGGYYLIGMKKAYNDIFADIPWSTDRVLEETMTRSGRAGRSTGVLPVWYDVDTATELERAREELRADGDGSYTGQFLNDLKLEWSHDE